MGWLKKAETEDNFELTDKGKEILNDLKKLDELEEKYGLEFDLNKSDVLSIATGIDFLMKDIQTEEARELIKKSIVPGIEQGLIVEKSSFVEEPIKQPIEETLEIRPEGE